MIDQNELERLSKAATQGVWEFRKIGHDHFQAHNAIEHEVLSTPRSTNAAFIVALVNAYRTGQLVPVQQPSGDVVEAENAKLRGLLQSALSDFRYRVGTIKSPFHWANVAETTLARLDAARGRP